MWLRRFCSSQGPSTDGWPATTLVGSNNPMFSEVHDGYQTNCCLTKTKKKLIKRSLKNSNAFCRISNDLKCSRMNCAYLRELARKN